MISPTPAPGGRVSAAEIEFAVMPAVVHVITAVGRAGDGGWMRRAGSVVLYAPGLSQMMPMVGLLAEEGRAAVVALPVECGGRGKNRGRRGAYVEGMKALAPSRHGTIERDGCDIHWEIFGDGDPTIFFLPTWSIIPSRHWKAQIPYFARHFRVLTFDGIGNGQSSRAVDLAVYSDEAFAADALAVMDATGTEQALLVSLSAGA